MYTGDWVHVQSAAERSVITSIRVVPPQVNYTFRRADLRRDVPFFSHWAHYRLTLL